MLNSAVIASLEAQPVPPDQECRTESLSQIIEGVVQYVHVAGLASTISGDGFSTPITNNIGQQAFDKVVALEGKVEDLEEGVRERRIAARRVRLNPATSIVPLTWSPAMPSDDYEVRISVYGPSEAPSNAFAYRIVSGTQTTTGITLVFTGIPDNSQFTAVIEEL
jgi:hypothetical protein